MPGPGHGLLVPARQPAPHGLVEHRLAPDLLDDHLRRHLARCGSRGPSAARPISSAALRSSRSSASLGDLHLEAHARVAELGGGGLHGLRA